MFDFNQKIDPAELDLKDTVVSINRVTKVVKGGKNLSFSALVVVGDGHGVVGFGVGKAKEVPSAIKKGIEAAKKSLIRVPLGMWTDKFGGRIVFVILMLLCVVPIWLISIAMRWPSGLSRPPMA